MKDGRPLSERNRPTRLQDVVGNPEATDALRRWAEGWAGPSIPRLRAAVLAGPPGVGKTSAALALAQDHGWTVIELNASDARNQTAIEQVAGRASLTQTLGTSGIYRSARAGGRSLILLDEADCLTGRLTEEASARGSPPSLREFLQGRYGTLDALSDAWGLGRPGAPKLFESWDGVPASAGRAAWTRWPAAQADLSDWKGAAKPKDLTDRGGLPAIARLVRDTRQPLILTVNDEQPLTRYSPVFRQGVARIHFHPVPEDVMKNVLRRSAVDDGLSISGEAMQRILRRSHGDVRAALNDLDAIGPLPPGPLQEAALGGRDLSSDFFELTGEIFRSPRFYRSAEVRDRLDATPDDLLPWVEENLPRFAADPAHRLSGFGLLGDAELALARARRHRVWGLWSFASELLAGGVGLAASQGTTSRSNTVAFPQFLGAMGRARVARAQRAGLTGRLGSRLHVSRRKGNLEFLPMLEKVFGASRATPALLQVRRELVRTLELTPEDVAYLLGLEPESAPVLALFEEAAESESPPTRKKPVPRPPPERTGAAPEQPEARKVQRRLVEF